MHYRRVGQSGLKVSALCLGTMTFGWSADEPTSFAIMDAAVAAGINFFDTADIYSFWVDGNVGGESETIIGKWLKTQVRSDIIIATKVRGKMSDKPNGQGLSRHHIIHSAEASLRRLQTDYIDLYQAHWFDDETPYEETLYAFDHLIRSGKVLHIGVSNYPAWKLMKLLWVSDRCQTHAPICLQPHYSLLHRAEFERELLPLCREEGVGVIPYSPLAAGFLTGKYRRGEPLPESSRSSGSLVQRLMGDERAYRVLDELARIAQTYDSSSGQIALAWLLANDAITAPIIGARTVEQLGEMLSAVEIQLSPTEVDTLNHLSSDF
jgi:aryl-alcohol dehydrogenase-like predicted oxidoreductase